MRFYFIAAIIALVLIVTTHAQGNYGFGGPGGFPVYHSPGGFPGGRGGFSGGAGGPGRRGGFDGFGSEGRSAFGGPSSSAGNQGNRGPVTFPGR